MNHSIAMKKLRCLIVFSIVLQYCAAQWWENSVIYQIYPRSFQDSDGDGIGDLNGITQRLGHIKDAGIGTIWLSPIYKSPMYDFGYDIADFREVQPEYGTHEDFDNLVKQAKSMGIKVVLDFVPNHASNESDWFALSCNRTKGYEDYFVWADGKPDPQNPGRLLPPSNWVSVFRKSAWEYNPIRKQFYLHQFAIAQPDLNYRDPKLVDEMKDILRFWLDKGVSGFRVDAVPMLFEVDPKDFGGSYPDEPRANVIGLNEDDYLYLNHIYTVDQEPTYDMVYQWRAVLDEYELKDNFPRLMLGEISGEIKNVMRYYGNETTKGIIPFNFVFMFNVNNNSDARDMKFFIDKWFTYMPVGQTANWVNGNHDNSRLASRFGVDKVDSLNLIALLLPGITLTYEGEELAMTDGEVTWEETKDPAACDTNDPINYYKISRDPERTPYHWDESKNAGFSTGNTTWLPLAKNFKEVNLKKQLEAPKSHYKFYKDLVALKKTRVSFEGDVDVRALSEDVLAILRASEKEVIIGVINLSDQNRSINLNSFRLVPSIITVYASSLNAHLQKGDKVLSSGFTLSPFDAVVFTA